MKITEEEAKKAIKEMIDAGEIEEFMDVNGILKLRMTPLGIKRSKMQ